MDWGRTGTCLPFRGFSRSRSTISTGLFLGLDKARVEEFSFALAVVLTPVVILKEGYRLLKAQGGFADGCRQPLQCRLAESDGDALQLCRRLNQYILSLHRLGATVCPSLTNEAAAWEDTEQPAPMRFVDINAVAQDAVDLRNHVLQQMRRALPSG
jgi:hypothetical protein